MSRNINKPPMPRERKIFIACIVAIVVALLVAADFFLVRWYEREHAFMSEHTGVFSGQIQGYDFEKLKKVYPDVVAWLDVPNTNIAMPIVQHPTSDFFYLNHNAQAQTDVSGAAFLELCNKKDFSDPVTVVYGHNMIDNGMFSTAHYFENPDFFRDNDKFYVFIPGHKLTYTVAAASVTDDRHIINTNGGFKDQNIINKYHNEIMNPTSMVKNIREGFQVKDDDKILQLSTCMSDPARANQRYVVTGVLTKDEQATS